MKTLSGHTDFYIYAIVFSPDGKTLISGSYESYDDFLGH